MLKKVICMALVSILLVALTACGGSSNSLVGQWESGNHQWEFFSDGTIIVGSRDTDIGSWTTNGNRLVVEGLRNRTVGNSVEWINGAHTIELSSNAFTLTLASGRSFEFTRVD